MARRLRYIPPGGALVEVTCRTIQGRFLLKPSRQLRLIILGALGRAQRRTRLPIHAFVFMSNHYHLLLSPQDAQQLARFMNLFNSKLAKEVARAHDWKDKVWARRYQAILVSDESAAQIARLRYLLSHGCKEGLVKSPDRWPGAHAVKALTHGHTLTGHWPDRTRKNNSRTDTNTTNKGITTLETIKITPLPCWKHQHPKQIRAHIRALVQDIRSETRMALAANGHKPLGVKEILRQQPHERPQGRIRRPAPLVHAWTRAARQRLRQAYAWFLLAYRAASERLRRGQSACFPKGAFPPPLPFVPVGAEVAGPE